MTNLENELNIEFGKDIDLVNFKYMNPLIKRKAIEKINIYTQVFEDDESFYFLYK